MGKVALKQSLYSSQVICHWLLSILKTPRRKASRLIMVISPNPKQRDVSGAWNQTQRTTNGVGGRKSEDHSFQRRQLEEKREKQGRKSVVIIK